MRAKVFRYVSQNVVGMIGISVYILADTFFISMGFGADGLAVLNMTLPLYGLIYALGSLMGIGSAVVYSLRKASGRDASDCFMQSVFFSILFSIPFIVAGIFVPEQMLGLLGADDNLRVLGSGYARLMLVFSPLFMLNFTFTAFCRNDGAPGRAMAGQLAGSAFNIVFDYVFMFPCGLGFTGAALATVCCPGLSILICLTHFMGKKNRVPFAIKKPSLKFFKRAVSLGMSGFVGEMSNGVTSLTYNFLMLSIAGNTSVAAYGVIANIALVCISIFNGISQGLQPLISTSYGKGRRDEVKYLFRAGIFIIIAAEAIFLLLGFAATNPLIRIFNSEGNEALASMAYTGMHLYFLGFIFAGVNIFLIAYFSATDKGRIVVTGSLLRGIILIVTCGILLSKLLGITGVWLAFFTAEAVTFAVIMLMSKKEKIQNPQHTVV